MKRIEVNVQTGEILELDLTQEEINALPSLPERKEQIKNQLINSRLSYLQRTDWYVAREIDESNSYPQEVKDKRIQARQEINAINIATTLSVLNAFSITFE